MKAKTKRDRQRKEDEVGWSSREKLVHAGLMLDGGFGCVHGCPEVID